jgi:hypothetical protein
MFSCQPNQEAQPTFSGSAEAVALSDQMFDAIGGKAGWCALRSLYIKANHSEPQMEIPYQSEIWRGIDVFQLVIEQQNDSFHVKGVFTAEGGRINYLDDRDTFRILTEEQLENWIFENQHNVYVLLHDLACDPNRYRVEVDEENLLAFYIDSTFLTSFGLDDQFRPYQFYRPNPDGSVSGSIFSQFGTDGGLVHSAGGHPLDSSFVYTTEIWQPSTSSMEHTFGAELFNLE